MDYASVRNRLIRAAAKTKTPMVGAFELTPSCNLACKMCYVRESFPKKSFRPLNGKL